MKNILAVFFCVLISACQPIVKPVNESGNLQKQLERESILQRRNTWSFHGRLAVSDDNQAGTVKIRWQQTGARFDIEISLPITGQKYRLHSVGSQVRLEGSGLAALEGDSAEAVLQQAMGWRIPFHDMQAWLRGVRADSATAIEFGPDGLPAKFHENGWLVDYRAWDSAATPLPMKVFANTGSDGKKASVRLQIEAWDTP